MRAYVIRRLLLIIPTVFLTSLIIFFMIRLIPGDIIDAMVVQMQWYYPVDRPALEHALGLDVPVYIQYGRWLGNIVMHGDLGLSLWRGIPVNGIILSRWPITLELGFLGLVIA